MGHKVNPISFRIPYIKSWKSTWYEDKKTYKNSLSLDIKAREILSKELTGIPLGDILVSKDQNTVEVVVYTAKSALILGKTGENKERETEGLIEAIQKFDLNKGLILTKDEEKEVKKIVNGKIIKIKIMPLWQWLLAD